MPISKTKSQPRKKISQKTKNVIRKNGVHKTISRRRKNVWVISKSGIEGGTPEYGPLNLPIMLLKKLRGGEKIFLLDGSQWEAKKEFGLNQSYAKNWPEKEAVVITKWDAASNSYLIQNYLSKEKSYWLFKGIKRM